MAHGIYFSANNDKEGFRLPINPEKVKVSVAGNGESFTIAKLGNVNIPKDVKLEEYEIESYFPFQPSLYSMTEHFKPQFYIDTLKSWQTNKLAIRYIYVDGTFTINELVTIESFDYEESDGSGDIYFTLSLKQYVSFGPKKMVVVKKPVAKKPGATPATKPKPTVVKKESPPRQNAKPAQQTYSLIKGDSLWKVAQKFLGSGSRYPEIQKLNGIKDSQLRKLPIGLKVKLPAK